jgi:hypothetical protein
MVSRVSLPRKAPPRSSKQVHSLVVLSVGLVGGVWLSKLLDRIWDDSVSGILLQSSLDFPGKETQETQGWGMVHVFYGDAATLQSDTASQQQFFSQVKQDEIVLDLMKDIKQENNNKNTSPYFIDLAANDATELSNTLALEQRGWDGICIEPNAAYWYGLSQRKCTAVGALVGENIAPMKVKFRGVYGGMVGTMDEKMADRLKEPDTKEETRYTVPFTTLLQRFHVPKTIDYLSLDVEGAEYLVMHDFPFHDYTVQILTIERPSKQLRSLLKSHGYVFLKDLAWWGETLWAHGSTGLTPSHPKILKITTKGKNR